MKNMVSIDRRFAPSRWPRCWSSSGSSPARVAGCRSCCTCWPWSWWPPRRSASARCTPPSASAPARLSRSNLAVGNPLVAPAVGDRPTATGRNGAGSGYVRGVPVADLRRDLPAEMNSLRYARTIDCDPHRAEDLVQDTLVRALERADSFREEASLRTWLHRILHNLAVDGFGGESATRSSPTGWSRWTRHGVMTHSRWTRPGSSKPPRPPRICVMRWSGCRTSTDLRWCCTMSRS